MNVDANIIIYNGKAYIPNMERADGLYYTNEPFIVTDIDQDEISTALKRAYARGNPQISRLSSDELKARKSPTLRVTGARNWSELSINGASWSIAWRDDGITYYASMLDKKNRWNWDPDKTATLPADTPISELVTMVLDDWESRITVDG